MSTEELTKECTRCYAKYGTKTHGCPKCGNWEFGIIPGTSSWNSFEKQQKKANKNWMTPRHEVEEYRIATWDTDANDFTVQDGVPHIVFGLRGLVGAVRALRNLGYSAAYRDGNDPSVLIERIDEKFVNSEAEQFGTIFIEVDE